MVSEPKSKTKIVNYYEQPIGEPEFDISKI